MNLIEFEFFKNWYGVETGVMYKSTPHMILSIERATDQTFPVQKIAVDQNTTKYLHRTNLKKVQIQLDS